MNHIEDGTDAQPTETTALLPERPPSQSTPEQPPLPLVEPVILRVLSQGIASCSDADFCPAQLNSRVEETAFSLIVLLYARYSTRFREKYRGDVLELWQAKQQQGQDLFILEQRLLDQWTAFLAQCHSDDEVEAALWASFPYEKPGHRSKRVVDFLCGYPVLEELLTHPVVLFSVEKTWRRGLTQNESHADFSSRLLHRFDALGTPRVMHAIDLGMLLAYMATLAHFVVLPPTRYIDQTVGIREIAIVIYSIAKLYKRPRFSVIPHILVLGAFTSHLPRVLYPDDAAFGALLFAFSWMVIDMHLPWSTSPLYLVSAEIILPRSVLIMHGISRIFIPVVTFFLPALLLSLFLLSTSLADMFPNILSTTFNLTPAPMESRVAFLSLFAILFLLMVCSLVMLVMVYPSFASKSFSSPWDQYSRPIGLEARRFFIRTVVRYSVPYTFPAPFNLLQLVIRLPGMAVSLVRNQDSACPVHAIRLLERTAWRVVIGPLAFIFGAFWLWGLRNY